MKKIIIALGVILTAVCMLSGCIDDIDIPGIPGSEEPCFQQQLYKEGDGNEVYDNTNRVILPTCAIADGDTVEIVFASILDKVSAIFYLSPSGDLSSWIPDQPYNSLNTVHTTGEYHIYVVVDCVFTI